MSDEVTMRCDHAHKEQRDSAAITMSTDATSDKDMIHYIRDLPKVELHAHLNGCIREETLFELAKERNVTLSEHHFLSQPHTGDDHSMYNVRPRSLQDCFDMFAEIPKCVDDLSSLTRITTETLEDFAQQHVVYLELRSTPKQLLLAFGGEKIASKRTYCETILESIKKYETKEEERYKREVSDGVSCPRLPLVCRFLVAVDRSQSAADAMEHVQLALSLQEDFKTYVVGVDLGGNPTKNNFKDFEPAFEFARRGGLKVTLHCAEVPCGGDDAKTKIAYEEAQIILEFRPDRLGHALLLPPSLQDRLIELAIPVESCPTSNVMTLELAKHFSGLLVEGLKQHPQLEKWLETKHPISIGTDDPGVFHTDATKELILLHKAWHVNRVGLQRIVLQSMDYAFCSDGTRSHIKGRMQDRLG